MAVTTIFISFHLLTSKAPDDTLYERGLNNNHIEKTKTNKQKQAMTTPFPAIKEKLKLN